MSYVGELMKETIGLKGIPSYESLEVHRTEVSFELNF